MTNGKVLRKGDEVTFGSVSCRIGFTAPAPDRPPPGLEQFDNIRLKRRVHVGEGGDIYEGEIQFSKGPRPVAVRIFPAGLSVQQDVVSRLAGGALEAAKFRHPNIVAVYPHGPAARQANAGIWRRNTWLVVACATDCGRGR